MLNLKDHQSCLKPNQPIEVSGYSKHAVGQTAANIRAVREPEPYLGKGIKYAGEHIIRKEGKRAGAKKGDVENKLNEIRCRHSAFAEGEN